MVNVELDAQVFVDFLKNNFAYFSKLALCWINLKRYVAGLLSKVSLWFFRVMKQLFLPLMMFIREMKGSFFNIFFSFSLMTLSIFFLLIFFCRLT